MRGKIEAGLAIAIVAWAAWMWVGKRNERELEEAARARQAVVSDEVWVVEPPLAMLAAVDTGFVGRVVVAGEGAEVCALPAAAMRGVGRAVDPRAEVRCVAVGEDGAYRLVGLAVGGYHVSASAPGFLPLRWPARPQVLQAGELREVDFTLALRGEAVHGVVRDALGGPIAGAVVSNDVGGHALSDDEGAFTMWLPAQALTIVGVSAPGYTAETKVAMPPQSVLQFVLVPESVLRGVVVRAEGGGPLVGLDVQVEADQVAAVSDEDGGFEVRGLEAGGWRPFVRSEGWCGEAETVTALGPGETSEPVQIAARRCVLVRAEVRVKGGEVGCAGAKIEVLDAAGDRVREALTDATGRVELSGVEPGAYSVRVQCPGAVQREPVAWLLGEGREVRVRWEVEPGRTLRGTVVDARGVAVPRANIEVVGPFGYVGSFADDGGSFVVEGLAPGGNKVRPYHAQHGQGQELELTIAEAGEPAPVQLSFAPEAAIAGTVRARGGALPANLTVVARALDNFGGKAVRVGEDGRYALPGLQQLPYRVVVQRAAGIVDAERAGELASAVEVDLRGGDATAIDFEVAAMAAATLDGRVEDAEGAGEVDAVVTVSDARTRERVVTDEHGRFTVAVEAGGTYRVTAMTRAGASVERKGVAPGSALVLKVAATRRVCGEVIAEGGESGRYVLRVDGVEVAGFAAPRWCLPEVAVGEHSLAASSLSLGVAEVKLKVAATGEVVAPVLKFAGRGTVRGKVVGGDGAPRAGATVWALDALGRLVGGHRVSDAGGEFTVAGASGEMTVVVVPPGPLPGRDALLAGGVKVAVRAGKTVDVVVSAP